MNPRERRTRVAGFAVFAALLVLPGCGSSMRNPRGGEASLTPRAAQATASEGTPYSLYTHCGIREARIGENYFVADDPLDDGQGNPPPGWGNPDQAGRITMPSPSVAVFRDSVGHVVRFHARPGATSFLRVCS